MRSQVPEEQQVQKGKSDCVRPVLAQAVLRYSHLHEAIPKHVMRNDWRPQTILEHFVRLLNLRNANRSLRDCSSSNDPRVLIDCGITRFNFPIALGGEIDLSDCGIQKKKNGITS